MIVLQNPRCAVFRAIVDWGKDHGWPLTFLQSCWEADVCMTLKGHPIAEFSAVQGEVTTFIKKSYLSSPARAWQCLQ